MLLTVPKGMKSVSVHGNEFTVKKGLVEVPDHYAELLFAHGLQPAPVEEETEEIQEPAVSAAAAEGTASHEDGSK